MAHTKKSNENSGRFILAFVGLMFFGMGGAFMWFMGIKPLALSLQSGDWPQVACTVTSSKVKTIRGSEGGSTYKVAITTKYNYSNGSYEGGSYSFSGGSSSGHSGKADIVSNYPVGKKTTCWVNPSNPRQAVISRNIPGIVWFVLPFTSIFVLVGGWILAAAFGVLPKRWSKTSHDRVSASEQGANILQPKHSAGSKILGYGLFTLFWNGIVSVFIVSAWEGFSQGKPEWGLTLFLIPFVLVGLFMFGVFVRSILAAFNPKAILELSESSPKLGQAVVLGLGFIGRVDRINRLTITLEGQESARYRVGTNHRTDTHTFYKKELLSTCLVRDAIGKTLEIQIPSDSMHTFTSSNNNIEWVIKLHGDILSWADVVDEYPIIIRPL